MRNILLITIASLFTLVGHAQNLKTFEAESGTEDDFESIMVALGGGCNLGCAIAWTLDATSTLPDQGSNAYSADNLDDGKRSTAWVEGKSDYGIGERITITFTTDEIENVPFDGIQITNGYAKSPQAWEDNSRVKLFKLHLNGQPQFFIKLQDSIYTQRVSWGRDFLVSKGDQVELEIVEVYKGKKWKDTAISDLSLNGAH